MEICTNNHWRQFKYSYEVPKDVMADYFDHLKVDEVLGQYIMYRNRWYHISDFMSLHNKIHCPNPPKSMTGWDGYLSDGFYSGILIKISDDGDCYRIGTYIS